MEGKVPMKKLLGVDENSYDDNKTEEPSIQNTLGSTLLSLRLNNSEKMPFQREEQLPTQIGLLRIKVEEAKKENQNLRAMVNQITEHYTALENRLMLAIKHQHQLSPRNNHELQGNKAEAGKPSVLSTRQFLDIGDPSECDGNNIKEGFASAENFKKIGRNLAYIHNNGEGEKIKSQITSEEAKSREDQGINDFCGKARVSIRARSDFSLMGDGCQWRKYGQKIAKGNPCPRAYYRCSMGTSCPVRKQVQRCFRDETVLITTYEGKHNHPLPPSATPMATTTSSALNMFLSGSITSSNNSTTPPNNSFLFPSLLPNSTNYSCSAFATVTPSASCPTVTLDLTHPTNNNNNYFQFKRDNLLLDQSQPLTLFFPLPLYGGHNNTTAQTAAKVIPSIIGSPEDEKSLALVDVVSEVIAKDPSLKKALFSAISSLNRDSHNQNTNNNNSQSSKSGLDPCSKVPVVAPQQPYTTQ